MGTIQKQILKEVKAAEDKKLSPEAIGVTYEKQSKLAEKRLQKSLDEQIPLLDEIERLTNVYKKWYPQDEYLQEHYKEIEAGETRRYQVLGEIDIQRKYPKEYKLIKENDLIIRPNEIPSHYHGEKLTDAQKRDYTKAYWTEYLRQLDILIGLTQEEMDEQKGIIVSRKTYKTEAEPIETTSLRKLALQAKKQAELEAERTLMK